MTSNDSVMSVGLIKILAVKELNWSCNQYKLLVEVRQGILVFRANYARSSLTIPVLSPCRAISIPIP